MVHPATKRVVAQTLEALNTTMDIGYVFTPHHPGERSYAKWHGRELSPADIQKILNEAAAANARGGNIFMRLGPNSKERHPGIIMLDDLSADAVTRLEQDGFEPRVVVETSPENFQAWIKLTRSGTSSYETIAAAVRELAIHYGGDPRAISPRQPGRIPGFTNRKAKHQKSDGSYPYVRLRVANPYTYARHGEALLETVSQTGTVRDARPRVPETPLIAAEQEPNLDPAIQQVLELIYYEQQARIVGELHSGRRPNSASSDSEVDFAFSVAAIQSGAEPDQVSAFLRQIRPHKPMSYSTKTTYSAMNFKR